MRNIIIFVALFLALSTCQAYDATQQAMYDGTQLSWKMAVAYTNQDIPTFNALAEQWNAWVRQHFGEDPNLIMKKMTGPVDSQKPYVAANNTTSGIVHKIDGNRAENKTYTTNDMNLLPDPGNVSQIKNEGGAWLGGV